MPRHIDDIRKALERYKQTPDSVGMELRLSFAEIVLRILRQKGWTQCQLAERARLKPPYISRVLHSNANCTFETAGKILFALGARGTLRETRQADQPAVSTANYSSGTRLRLCRAGCTSGQEGITQEDASEGEAIVRQACAIG